VWARVRVREKPPTGLTFADERTGTTKQNEISTELAETSTRPGLTDHHGEAASKSITKSRAGRSQDEHVAGFHPAGTAVARRATADHGHAGCIQLGGQFRSGVADHLDQGLPWAG
jgi:hypothetical protein